MVFRRNPVRLASDSAPQQLPASAADNNKGKQPLEMHGRNQAQIAARLRMAADDVPLSSRFCCRSRRF
jgi:hypothetical protein